MQPQEPPSSEQPTQDAQASAASSEPTEATPAQSWQRGLLGRLFRNRPAADEASQEPPADEQPSAISLTQEELDRRIQAETDRREAKRAAQALAERKRKLRDEDPWAFAEEERTAEQAQQVNAQVGNLFGQVGAEHDKYTIDPLVQALPEAERKRILAMEGAGVALDGRKLIVTEGLKALERVWKAEGAKDAETKLRRNPAFRKQVLAEMRGITREPEFLPSGAASEADKTVSQILRGQLGSRRGI